MPVRVGVIGCGAIACGSHLRALCTIGGATIVAGADPDARARARAAPFVTGAIHDRWEDLLARSDVDAVLVTAPPETHAPISIAAARSGRHVYVEKPLAIEAAGAARVIEAALGAGIVATVGFNYRWHPAHVRARRWLAEGRIGAVRAVQSVFCEPSGASMPEWKTRRSSGGGALLDLASHHVDLVRWFLAEEISSVRATISTRSTEADTATLRMTTTSGTEVDTFVSFRAGLADRFFFVGERGTILVDRHRAVPLLDRTLTGRYGVRRQPIAPTAQELSLWARRLVQPSYEPSFRRALAAFIHKIEGAAVELPTLEDGAASLAVLLAAEASHARGDAIELR
jgi:predicted dehydrogenase